MQLEEARNRAAHLDRADVYLLGDVHTHRRAVNAIALEGPRGFKARSQHKVYAAVVGAAPLRTRVAPLGRPGARVCTGLLRDQGRKAGDERRFPSRGSADAIGAERVMYRELT